MNEQTIIEKPKKERMPADIKKWLKKEQKRLGVPYQGALINLKLREVMENQLSSNTSNV